VCAGFDFGKEIPEDLGAYSICVWGRNGKCIWMFAHVLLDFVQESIGGGFRSGTERLKFASYDVFCSK
jgi:hypothetical protein